jgi:hypothetical protein
VLPINIQLSKNKGFCSEARSRNPKGFDSWGLNKKEFRIQKSESRIRKRPHHCSEFFFCLVGLGRVELPTSPLSGVRSSQLSYRPGLNWWSWSGSNRRPPECKSGALPAELQPLVSDWWLVTGDWLRNRKPATNHQPLATIFVSRPIGRCRPAPGRTDEISRRT